MALKKQYMKSKPVVKVTFRLPKAAAGDASSVSVVGEFNGWNIYATPMDKLKDGSFKKVVDLTTGAGLRVPLPHRRNNLGERLGRGPLRAQPLRQLRQFRSGNLIPPGSLPGLCAVGLDPAPLGA